MYCLFTVIFLANSFSCLSTVENKLMKMLLSDPGDQAGIYLKVKNFTRIAVSIWNSIPLSVKTLNISNFRKKIKSLLLNVLGNEDNYLNVNYLIEYFMKLT